MGIIDIPNELILMIAGNLRVEDLSSLLSTCSKLSSSLTPSLHKLAMDRSYVTKYGGRVSIIQWAAARGHESLLRSLVGLAIAKGTDINARYFRFFAWETLLHLAAGHDQHGVIRILVQNGARIDAKNSEHDTPLFVAVQRRCSRATRVLLELGADMEHASTLGTPAHILAMAGDIDSLRAIMVGGFDFTIRSPGEKTILHFAIFGGKEMVKYLLQQEGGRAIVNVRDCYGSVPLHLVERLYPVGDRADIVRLLLQNGADMYQWVRYTQNTSAHCAAERGDIGSMIAFIDGGFDINTRGELGQTVLHQSISGGGKEMMEYILGQAGASAMVNARDYCGRTPLHYAVESLCGEQKVLEMVRSLLQWGADVFAVDREGNMPAHGAAKTGLICSMMALIDAGFNIHTRGAGQKTLLHFAIKGMTTSIFHDGRDQDMLEIVRWLLQRGADVFAVDSQGNMPAHYAAASGIIGSMMPLIDAGFDIHTRGADQKTVLHFATEGGNKIMEYILGQDGGKMMINARDSDGSTPMHLTAKDPYGRGGIEPLLRHGADVHAKDGIGNTAAHYARNPGIMRLLVEAGFKIHTTGNKNKTILHAAARYDNDIVGYLLELEEAWTMIDAQDDNGSTPLDYLDSLEWTDDPEYRDLLRQDMLTALARGRGAAMGNPPISL